MAGARSSGVRSMAANSLPLAALLICTLLFLDPAAAAGEARSSYVVYLGDHAHGSRLGGLAAADLAALEEKAAGSHHDLLATILGE